MQNYNVRAIGEVALMAVILFVLVFLGVYGYGIIQFMMFLTPLPVAIVHLKYGFKHSLLEVVIAAVLSCIFIDPKIAALVMVMFLIPSVVFIISTKKGLSFSKTFIIMSIAYIAATVFEYTAILKVANNITFINIVDDMVNSAKSSINDVGKMYLEAGMNKQQVDDALDILRQSFTRQNILNVVPGLLTILSTISAYFTCFVGERIFNRLKIKVNYQLKIYNIYINNLVLAFSIILGCIGLVLKTRNIILGDYIYYTVSMTMGLYLIVTGLSLIVYYLKFKQKLSNWIIALILVVGILLVQLLYYVYMALAFVDSFMDFRKIGIKKSNKKQGEI
ncbi:hypothetical protein NL50_16865 [Clostridium acetobutylicum]|nr:hypothetical protein NL50_16865 [Clostridium acetobutylicum]